MSRKQRRLLALLLCIPLASTPLAMILLGSSPPPEEPPPAVVAGPALDSPPTVDLGALLSRPRAELAALGDEVATKINNQNEARREGRLPFSLTPDLNLALDVPVLHEAHFVSARGFSLPPYLADDAHDTALALHLARYGDVEAALQIADPADSAARTRIEACRTDRNYPIEWTRLAGLLLHEDELRLATGDLTGGGELIGLHRQLREALDARAAAGPLGAALLSRGHKLFRMVAEALRARGGAEDADKATAILNDWGPIPAPAIAIQLGAPRAEVERQLAAQGKGRATQASPGRALDILNLPTASEGVDAVTAFFEDDRLTEVVVTYRGRISERFRNPVWLALPLEDRDLPARDEAPVEWFPKRSYDLGELLCDYGMSYRGQSLGAVVRFHGHQPSAAAHLSRDFGAVCLDRSFEQNRLRLVPEALAETVHTSHAAALRTILNPLAPWQLTRAALHRQGSSSKDRSQAVDALVPGPGYENRTARIAFEFPVEQNPPPLAQLALPLWTAYGPGRIEPGEDANGDFLGLTWEDAQTRYTIRLPNGIQPTADFIAEDRTTGVEPDQQRAAVTAFDQAERKERFAKGTLLAHIPRTLGLEGVELGTPRETVAAAVEALEGAVQFPIARGLVVVLPGDSAVRGHYSERQLIIRWDQAGRVVELRGLYQDAPGGSAIANWGRELILAWKKRCGAPHVGTIATAWPENAASRAATFYQWVDDQTILTAELGATGVEMILRPCTEQHPLGVPLPALQYLSRGPEGCALGERKDDVLTRWKGSRSGVQADGSVDLTPDGNGAFEVLRVWFHQDRIARVVALYREPKPARPDEAAQLLQATWNDQLATLGWATRQEFTPQEAVQSLGWQDERTRWRLFWEKTPKNPPRIYSEWKDLEGR